MKCLNPGTGLVLAMLLLGLGCGVGGSSSSKSAQKAPAANPKQPMHSEFEQIGYFKSDKMRGFTFFVTGPNKQDIEEFCQKKKERFSSGRILKIHFFDDRANTPEVSARYYFPESSDAHLVADYFFNPFNRKQGLKIHKKIPGQSKPSAAPLPKTRPQPPTPTGEPPTKDLKRLVRMIGSQNQALVQAALAEGVPLAHRKELLANVPANARVKKYGSPKAVPGGWQFGALYRFKNKRKRYYEIVARQELNRQKKMRWKVIRICLWESDADSADRPSSEPDRCWPAR